MSGNEKQQLVPRLRFPEFKNTAEWQSPTLGEVSEPVEDTGGERKLTPVSISAGIGFVPQAEKFGRDISGANTSYIYRSAWMVTLFITRGTLSSSHKVAYTIFKVGVKLQHLMFLSAFA
ncbi:Uncharacterised protein [Klebsiella pneumoniae]|uniref:Uncharacterized protein n=1 Tax=Klebsiella pneumoniae TaxID=573 RepID=A0A377VAT7_KLEPN|nr:Uncharacterised protein [Klebsiella pneumoniae]